MISFAYNLYGKIIITLGNVKQKMRKYENTFEGNNLNKDKVRVNSLHFHAIDCNINSCLVIQFFYKELGSSQIMHANVTNEFTHFLLKI